MEDIEALAREQGWRSQEEYKGNPESWIDAEAYVERGKHVMPLLKATNKKLEDTVARQAAELERLQSLATSSQASIEELKAFHEENLKDKLKSQRESLLSELRAAKEAGDTDREVAITEDLADVRAMIKDASKKEEPPKAKPSDAMHPDFEPWRRENPWFGVDDRRTVKAMGYAQVLRADPDNDHLQGRAFFDKVVEMMDGKPTSKVGEGGRHSGGASGGTKGKSYASLPPEAKETCDRQSNKFSYGEGKMFADKKAFQDYYAKLYFEEGQ